MSKLWFYNIAYNFLYLQTGWSISVELVIGPDDGISCLTDKASTVSFKSVSYFFQIERRLSCSLPWTVSENAILYQSHSTLKLPLILAITDHSTQKMSAVDGPLTHFLVMPNKLTAESVRTLLFQPWKFSCLNMNYCFLLSLIHILPFMWHFGLILHVAWYSFLFFTFYFPSIYLFLS